MPKISLKKKAAGPNTDRKTIIAKTKNDTNQGEGYLAYQWWLAENETDMAAQLISTANYLQKKQQFVVRQASIMSRVYSGKPLMNYALNSRVLDTSNQLPIDRPTMNVAQSCVDTLHSRLTQSRPRPIFLTDNGHYKERNLSKQLNSFISGEFYRMKAHDLGAEALRDAEVLGDGLLHVFEKNKKVCLERLLKTEVLVDANDAYYGNPRQMIRVKLMDRAVFATTYPESAKLIEKAMKAYVDGSPNSTETVTDQVMMVEGWHLPSVEGADDGKHVIACSAGVILEEDWKHDYFPFVKIGYNANLVGYWSQSLVELLLGTQIEINKMLITASQSINLMGVPRVWMNITSKINEIAFNNSIGTIIKGVGEMPEIIPGGTGLNADFFEHLQRLIQYAYQQSGISAMAASSQKPQGLDSGEAIRSFDDLQSDRFAAFAKRYDNFYVDLAYQVIDLAKEICERDGEYTTVYPNKDGTREVDLPKAAMVKDTYVIQCYDESSLPRDPAGRYARLSEMLAAGEISLQEFRRLSGFPDLEQSDKLANALEERILQILDGIVETGKYIPPDTFLLDPTGLGKTLTTQYINLYAGAKLEESKMQLLRDFFTQLGALEMAAQPPPQPMGPPGAAPGQPGAMPPPVPPQAPVSPTSNVSV